MKCPLSRNFVLRFRIIHPRPSPQKISRDLPIMLRITLFLGLMLPIYTLAQNATGNFLVGAARVDITPKPNPQWLPLNEFALEPLHIRAVVFSNNNVTGALLTIEIVSTTDQVMKSVTSAVAAELDTPIENIIFTATHSHAAGPAGPSLTAVQAYAAGPVRHSAVVVIASYSSVWGNSTPFFASKGTVIEHRLTSRSSR